MSHGRHVKVVGYGDAARLGAVDNVRAFLEGVVQAVGMRPLGEPQMHDVALDLEKMNVEPFEDEGGVTGVVVLSTSHCSIHTWPLRRFFTFDLYSCRGFSDGKVLMALSHHFAVQTFRLTDLTDSLEPPPAP
jgi:S-adenosylmethionine decarboxylase